MQIYTSDKTTPRSFPWLWYLRLVAIIGTLIVLAITAQNSATFHNIGCDAPGRLNFNLAVSVLSFVALIYFLLASGPSRTTRLLPWFIFGQLALDVIMFVFWLAAGATSSYSCTDLCNACGIYDGYVFFDTQSCECSTFFFKRDYSPRRGNVLQPRRGRLSKRDSTVGGTIAAKQAFDAIMTALFALFIIADLFWIIKSRRSGTTTAPTPTHGAPTKNEEAGMPMGGVGAPTYAQQPGSDYNNQMGPQGGYTGQPMQHHDVGQPQQSMAQEPYPAGQYHQGQPQYPNQTSYPQGQQQVPMQSYPSPQGEYPPQYGGPVPQQASYAEPRDGVSEMHSPTEPTMMNGPHHV